MRLRRALRLIVLVAATLVGLLLLTLALPIERWRTGEQPAPALPLEPAGDFPAPPWRLWIDTDAACGEGPRTDVDDCLAILLLARTPGVQIVGISSVFGNASLATTDRTVRALVEMLATDGATPPPVFRGSEGPLGQTESFAPVPAHAALRDALIAGPLTIVALGPLTNVAAALRNHPDLHTNIVRLVAVMGRQPGHLFHPGEGAGGGMLFGHGPLFRDFNVAMDPQAVVEILTLGLETTLVPDEAARLVEVTEADLAQIAASGRAPAWIAQRAGGWLDFWRRDIGREGFYPFDLLAARYVVAPATFGCAYVTAWVGPDDRLYWPFSRTPALLVSPPSEPPPDNAAASGSVLYCPEVNETAVTEWLVE
jgi:purine nucleosidase